jgi:hypothetical protein
VTCAVCSRVPSQYLKQPRHLFREQRRQARQKSQTTPRPCLHVYTVQITLDSSLPRALGLGEPLSPSPFCRDSGNQENPRSRYLVPCLWGKRTLLYRCCTASHAESDGPISKRSAYSSPAATVEYCHATGSGLEAVSRGVLVPNPTTHCPKVSGVRQRQRGVLTIK